MRKFGFTLFETLLALAIIGVVTAITIPQLINNHQKTVYVTSLHKFYNDLNYAVENYMAEQHVDDLADSDMAGSAEGLNDFVNQYFKIQKHCGTRYYENEENSCFARYYKTLNGNQVDLTRHQCNVVFRMQNGMSVCMDAASMEDINPGEDNSVSSSFNEALGYVLVSEIDTNGPEGPNILGRDLFMGIAVSPLGKIEPKSGADGEYFESILNNNWKMNY